MDFKQLKTLVVEPTLKAIDLFSEEIVTLIMATIAQESRGGYYLAQLNGPALGIVQMEPATYNDLWDRYLVRFPLLMKKVLKCINSDTKPPIESMIYNIQLSIIMARILYLDRVPASTNLPDDDDDLDGYWHVYKKYYNTEAGKAKIYDFVNNYRNFKYGKL